MTAVIYALYSSDNQREESIEGQIRECTAYAEKNGITVVKHYIDRALSAKTDNRPDFQQMIKDSERVKLDNAYLSALKRLGLTPAAACGIQSLLTPKTLPGQTAPEENAPAANPQPKQGNSQPTPASAPQRADRSTTRSASQQTLPAQQSRAAVSRTVPFTPPQSAARQRTDCYVVLSTKVQGGMSGSSTLVTLRAPDGKQIPAFARGARPELSAGTVQSNVKLTMRQQDTVAYYV